MSPGEPGAGHPGLLADQTEESAGPVTSTDPRAGLDPGEAARRLAEGHGNGSDRRDPRPLTAILRTNVVTRFNALLGVMGLTIAAVGAARDALFVIAAVVNTVIGVTQELRARRSLRRLELVEAPTARVVRGGDIVVVPPPSVVLGDIVVVGRGDQIVADGRVVQQQGLELDESLLTGESDPVTRDLGDLVLSGSSVVAGTGRCEVTAVGTAGFANALVAEATEFRPRRSEMSLGIDQILRAITWLLVPTAVVLAWSQLQANKTFGEAVTGTVAGTVTMVPEGLVLLVSMAMAVGIVRLSKRDILTRELAAIEGLARIDTLCVDKTGTLTASGLKLGRMTAVGTVDAARARQALGALARVEADPNATAAAIARSVDDPGWVVSASVAFSSGRRWSGADFGVHGSWVLGAPDALTSEEGLLERAEAMAATGARTLVVARVDSLEGRSSIDPHALVTLEEPVKAGAAATMRYLIDQGVTIKVVSGDHPSTVAAVARAVGLRADEVADASCCETDEQLAFASSADVVGRAGPAQKAEIVRRLQQAGHVVAMTGDGVNDLLALKQADVAVAMGSGSQASRSVAQFVLLADEFGAIPQAVREGRRLIANMERVARLFLTKSSYAFFLAIAVVVARLPFPVLPRHLSLVAALTIGVPGFLLALEENDERASPGFVARVFEFALPTGLVAATASFAAYADLGRDGATLAESRTSTVIVLFAVATWALSTVMRPVRRAHLLVLSTMLGLFVLVLALPAGRSFFALELPSAAQLPVLVAVGAVALTTAELLFRQLPVIRRLGRRARSVAVTEDGS